MSVDLQEKEQACQVLEKEERVVVEDDQSNEAEEFLRENVQSNGE